MTKFLMAKAIPSGQDDIRKTIDCHSGRNLFRETKEN